MTTVVWPAWSSERALNTSPAVVRMGRSRAVQAFGQDRRQGCGQHAVGASTPRVGGMYVDSWRCTRPCIYYVSHRHACALRWAERRVREGSEWRLGGSRGPEHK